MDANYICPKLKKLAELLYPKKGSCYSFKTKKGEYSFGWIDGKKSINNLISKQVAIYLVIEKIKKK